MRKSDRTRKTGAARRSFVASAGLVALLAAGLGGGFSGVGDVGINGVWAAESENDAATSTSDATAEDAIGWASRLCRANGGDWTRLIPVVVENRTKADYKERPVSIPIAGTASAPVDGALPLADELAQSIRVCDSTGVELIFNVVRADGTFVDKGPIGNDRALTIPATVPAGTSARFFVFAGNDRAFPNPDRLNEFRRAATNLDFEVGTTETPDGWVFDQTGEGEDRKLVWTDESPASGAKCVRCDVARGAKPSWIAARQTGVAIEPGARYRFSASVRGKDVEGEAGWYLHFGNVEKEMIFSPMLYAPSGDFDWTTVSGEFTAPENADLLSFGTVLYGTGTAWFDSASLVRIGEDGREEDSLKSSVDGGVRVESEVAVPVPTSVYPTNDPNADGGAPSFDPAKLGIDPNARFATVRIDAPRAEGERLIRLDLGTFETRWGRTLGADDFAILDLKARPVEAQFFDGAAFFAADVVADARNYFVVVEKNDGSANANGAASSKTGANVANQAFPGTMLQATNAEKANDAANADGADGKPLGLPKMLAERNLLSDGDFESVDPKTLDESTLATDGRRWTRDADEPGVKYSIVGSGVPELGEKSLKVEVGDEAPMKWRGWRRLVDVEPGRTYCVGYAVSTDSRSGQYDLHMHWRKADGTLAAAGMTALGKPVGGTTDWTLRCGSSRASSDAAVLELHLTNQTRGTVEYDSVFVAPVDVATPVEFFGGRTGVFQVPAVAKVFRDSTFAASATEVGAANPATCALALGEEETLQLAFRPATDGRFVVDAPAPTLRESSENGNGKGGDSTNGLPAPELFAVGNVVVDYPTSYYQAQGPETVRKFPSSAPACDGWIGYWPDPLIPIETASRPTGTKLASFDNFDKPELWNDSQRLAKDGVDGVLTLAANETRAVWLRFKSTSETTPGVYDGALTLRDSNGNVEKIPYSVEILNFVAPQTKVAGIYDARIAKDYFGAGSRTEKLRKIADKLLERKLSPDQPVAEPKFQYDAETGVATADWTEYDAVAGRYFDELGGKAAYYPGEFYLFGWGIPPKEVAGEKPYPGEWPYDGADRAQLRPEYKRAYQAKLKLYWEHIKEKGWADKLVLYISDEPFYSNPEIIVQMKALCDMIHEVDPAIPIYSSTWVFVPEWLGYLDVWGVGHYGGVGEEALKTIRDAGSRIWWTTDGQMCLDTPLCAVERLLPYTCVARGAEVYEFWGATWLTCDPFESASHLYISQSDQPGVRYYVRYPNGDGYIFYPGDSIGRTGEILDSIRSEQAREGVEDAGWLVGLQNAISEKTAPGSKERRDAQIVLDRALNYLPLQCGSGRFSTRYMSDPSEFERIRLDVGRELEKLTTR